MKVIASSFHIRRIALIAGILAMHGAQSQIIFESRPYRDTRQPAPTQARQQPQAAFDLPIDAIDPPAAKARPAQAPTPAIPPVVVAPVAPAVPAPTPVIPVWEIRLSDINLSRALSRWAAASPEKLPILWEAPQDLPVVAGTYKGDFLSAIEQVMIDSGNSQYPVHACAHDNIVRVLHVSQRCVRGSIASATATAPVYGAEK